MRPEVSIQLVSPASGEQLGLYADQNEGPSVSIQLVSPASGEETEVTTFGYGHSTGFHSISFPSEWGVGTLVMMVLCGILTVSIQLVSPASGEFNGANEINKIKVFPFN